MASIFCKYWIPLGSSSQTFVIPICNNTDDFSKIKCNGYTYNSPNLPSTATIECCSGGYCTFLVEFVLKDNITSVRAGLFRECSYLVSCTLPDSIDTIEQYAFYDCTYLNELICLSSNTFLTGGKDTTFYGVKEGGTLYYPSGSDYSSLLSEEPYFLGYYDWNAVEKDFSTSKNLICTYEVEDTTTPISLTYSSDLYSEFYSDVLYNGVSIGKVTEYTFPNTGRQTVEFVISPHRDNLGGGFENCTKLVEVVMQDAPHTYNFNKIGAADFSGCTSLESIRLTDSIEEIQAYAFYGCESLNNLLFKGKLKTIENNAFYSCTSLDKITTDITTAPTITPNSFEGVKYGGNLDYPEGSDYSTWLAIYPYYLGNYNWNGVADSEEDTLPHSITLEYSSITFDWYKESKIVGLSYENIDDFEFEYGSNITNIYLSDGYIRISCDVNYGEEINNWVRIKGKWLGKYVYIVSLKITQNEYPKPEENGRIVMKYHIPRGESGNLLLYRYSALADYSNMIGYYLPTIYVDGEPISITSTNYTRQAQYEISTSREDRDIRVEYQYGQGKIVDKLFYVSALSGQYEPSWLSLPDSITSIGSQVFYGLPLTSIEIGKNLKTIGDNAFGNLEELESITIKTLTAPTIEPNTFYGVKEYGTLYYPSVSDYSSWLSTDNYYLGKYYWNAEPTDFSKGRIYLEYDSRDFDGYAISTSIDVTYQDIITVNPPTVSADWINLTTMATVSDAERYYFSLERNEGDDRQGTITFSGYDEDNYLITKALTITQDNFEDKMATSIALRKTSLEFPYEGSTLYMQVDYINPNEVLAPVPAQEWITVEENQRGTATSGNDTIIQVQYRVTMGETSFSRQASITFRCTDAAGNVLTDSHFMCYQAAPPTAEMTFNPTVLNFPYTGGTGVVEVTCKQPNSGGLTIETSSDYITGFRTTDTYEGSDGYTIYTVEVTVGNENTGTTNLNEVLEFSYTDIFDSYIKVDYPVVIGYAGEGTVHAFTQTAEVNADGSPEFSSFTSINCGYSGVTIHTPVVEGDWIILGEGTQQTGTFYGYDTVMNYPISFSANEGGARIGTITFSGTDGLGNTKTDVCTITQLAFEGGGEEDPDTPDIPSDSTEVYYGSIWKDVEYSFGGSENVTYTISTIEERWYPHIGTIEEETVIYKGTAWKSPDREGLSVIINKICQNYFPESRLPLGSAVGITQNYKKFILRGEFGNILRTYHFVNDWSYQDLKMGLKTNPIIPYIVEGQYCFFSTLSFGEMDVPWGMDYFDGQQSYRNVEMLDDEYTTLIIPNSRRQGISRFWFGSRYYDYVPKCKSHYVLYYLNPYGGWDWFPIMGNVKRTDNLTSYTYTQNYNNTTLDFGTSKYLNEIKIRYRLNTGWIKEYQADRMWELIESNKVYLHDTETDEIYPVVITDTDVEWKRKTPTNKIVNYDINIELSQTRERL